MTDHTARARAMVLAWHDAEFNYAAVDRVADIAEALAEVERETQDRDTWKAKCEHLEATVAGLENELCTAKDQIPPDMDGDSLSVALIKLKDERKQLAACREALEKCLGCLMVYNGGDVGSPYSGGRCPNYVIGTGEAIEQAQQALNEE